MTEAFGIFKLLWDVVKTCTNWFVQAKSKSKLEEKALASTSPLAVAERFVELFEAHGVKRSQIPGFFGHGLELKHFIDNRSLLEVLSEEHLQAAAELFGIRCTWLHGTSEEIYKFHYFYKQPDEFKRFLDKLLLTGRVQGGYLLVSETVTCRDSDALLIFEEQVGEVGNVPIYRYHICGDWIFEYWKSRAYIAACVAYAWERKAYVHGRKLPEPLMLELSQGIRFLSVCDWHSGVAMNGKRFDADDLADRPDVYLDGVDEGLRGKILGLELWLKLEAKGHMRNGFGEPPREAFELALLKIREYQSLNTWQRYWYRRSALKTGENLFVFQ